jgi:toxin ParE1/3/4
MGRIVRTRQAREDVLAIWEYIAADNETAADRLLRRFDETARRLSENPALGSSQARFRQGLRCMPVGNYLIFYEPITDGIRILRVLHGARRWEDLLP